MNDERPVREDQLKTGSQTKAGGALETRIAAIDRPLHRASKEVSVLAWVDDDYGHVLFVRQLAGKRLWSLPGGKVAPNESLEEGLRRETFEEIGVHIASLEFVTIFDRPAKASLAFLYRVKLLPGKMKFPKDEIETAGFFAGLPPDSTPTARYFWQKMRPEKGHL